MLGGLGLGLAVAAGVYLRSVPSAPATERPATAPRATPSTARAAPPAAQAAPPAAQAAPVAQKEPDETRFTFYDILPQAEVQVLDSGAATLRNPPPRAAEPPGSFLLQAGSFSAPADADRLKAQLALLGFESHVQRVTVDDNVFNRVRIGPIADLDTAKQAQRRLRDAGIDSLLMRVPK
jgi:cell division protein FtsN